MTKRVPEIRFESFRDDWEQRKLIDLLDLENGYAYKSEYFQDDPSRYVLLTPGNVNIGGGFLSGKGRFYKPDGPIPDKFIFSPHDIFITLTDLTPSGQTLGYPAQVPDDTNVYLHNQRLGKFINLKVERNFLLSLLITEDYHRTVVSTSSGTTVKHSSPQKVLDYVTSVPSFKEQTKIGAFFKQLDDTIALHQRKLEQLQSMKDGFLQKMFPKDGEKEPEIRFSGFTDDWEQRKLGELSNIVGGGTPSTSNPEYWDGDIDWYAPAEIGEQSYVNKSKKTITELGLKKSSARILPVGTVLFTSRAGIGNTAILAKEATTNQGFQSIVPDQNKLDSYFIFSRTNELKRYGEVTGAGSTFVEVSGKQMSKMPIMVPVLSEQQEIGTFLEQIDNTITLHQRELELLKQTKKAFLQKMFV